MGTGHIYKSHCLSVGQKEERQFEVGSDRFCHWSDTALFLPLAAMPNKFQLPPRPPNKMFPKRHMVWVVMSIPNSKYTLVRH